MRAELFELKFLKLNFESLNLWELSNANMNFTRAELFEYEFMRADLSWVFQM